MKYKLIHRSTNQETICEKVIVDGFDYYVSDENPSFEDENKYCFSKERGLEKVSKASVDFLHKSFCVKKSKKVIATNNPNIDIPKVVDEVEELALKITLQPKVLFDELKKYSQNDALLADEFGDYNIVKYRETTGFISGYNKSQETHPFSEDDIVEFTSWCAQHYVPTIASKELKYWQKGTYQNKEYYYSTKQLLELWKSQRIKTLYYE